MGVLGPYTAISARSGQLKLGRDLAAQDGQLMMEHEDLGVLGDVLYDPMDSEELGRLVAPGDIES